MFGFRKAAKRKKFYEESMYQFFLISDEARVSRDKAIDLLQWSVRPASDALDILESLADQNMKPIDGAIVLSDLIVRDTLAKVEFISRMLGSNMSAIDEDLNLAEKIQRKAFTIGNELGANIAPRQGNFGKKLSEIMGEYIKPVSR